MKPGDRVRTPSGYFGTVLRLDGTRGFEGARLLLDTPPGIETVYPASVLTPLEKDEQMTETMNDAEPGTLLPVVPQPDTELERFRTVGWWLALAESGDQTQKALGAAAALRLFYVSELGLPPLAAAELSVIHGRVFVGSKLLRALAARQGYGVTKLESTAETCTAAVVRTDTGQELGRSTFTIEDAKAAGLVRDGSGWKKYPARMLWARASKYALDDFAPAVTLGIWTDDERGEILGQPATPSADAGTAEDELAEWVDAEGEEIPFGEEPAGT